MTVGILGGGQLGRMLLLAGYPLGLRFRTFDPVQEACVDGLAPRTRAEYTDFQALAQFASGLDVVTYEFENVPVEAARYLEDYGVRVAPSSRALQVSQDRLIEKQFLREHGVPTADFAAVDSLESLRAAVSSLGLPAVLKTRRFGYDGKGQTVLRGETDIEAAWADLGGTPLILEAFVPFTRELSIVAARGMDGDVACYPLVLNHHAQGILRRTIAPAPDVTPALQAEAEAAARRILEALDYVGVLTIELFDHAGRLVANELAPRVHNSGHWTIEGAETSQFEQHIRAVTGMPLGSTAPRGYSVMLNFIGTIPPLTDAARLPGVHIHLYDKPERPGRKVGHLTLRADDPDTLAADIPSLMRTLVGLDVGGM